MAKNFKKDMAVEKTTMEDKKLLNVEDPLVVESTTSTITSATTDQVDKVDKIDEVDKVDKIDEVDKEKSTTNNSLAENIKTERNEPVYDREPAIDEDYDEVGKVFDEIFNKVDVSELYFRAEQPYDIPPLSKYFLCEWSEAEHLFRPAMEFAEEVFGEWSPCPSPSRSCVGL